MFILIRKILRKHIYLFCIISILLGMFIFPQKTWTTYPTLLWLSTKSVDK
nr:MAG TPA: protein of unknown function (DUF4094) [Caudoviricetes sp.]